MRGRFSLFAILAVMCVVPAFAVDPDWAAAATTVKDGLSAILVLILPVAAGLFALMMGPTIVKRLVSRFSKG